MQPLPHNYSVTVTGQPDGHLGAVGDNLPHLAVEPPPQFGGAGDQWSPEELLMASVSTCLVLSFRAIARASGLEWTRIDCVTEGKLDKVDRSVKFTDMVTRVELTVTSDASVEAATEQLHKAERTCFVSNSLAIRPRFECRVDIAV